jgi:hypothetical protein
MDSTRLKQRIILKIGQEYDLLICIDAFLIDRKSQNLSKRTIEFYLDKLKKFTEFCDSQLLTNILEIDADMLRQYMLLLEKRGHNPGGCHAHFRVLRTFLYGYSRVIEIVLFCWHCWTQERELLSLPVCSCRI